MGISRRLAQLFRVKANTALDRAEDPREVLDYSYQRQVEMLARMRRGLADVATSRKRLELQVNQLQRSAEQLREQAAAAVGDGREDLAREALVRRAAVRNQLDDVAAQHAALRAEESRLTAATQRMQATVDAFRTRKETIKATYTAAEAHTRINEAVSGISEEMGDVGIAMRRAEEKTEEMSARAAALDELMASGVLDNAALPMGGRTGVAALDAAAADIDVDRELAELTARREARPLPPGEEAKP